MARKKKIKAGAEVLVHMSKEWAPKRWEDLLLLDPTDERVQQMKELGFEPLGSYRLTRITGGRVDVALPKSGVFACASSPLAESPWTKNQGDQNENL